MNYLSFVNRPAVAGAVLQTLSSFIYFLSESSFVKTSSKQCLIQTSHMTYDIFVVVAQSGGPSL